MSEQGAGGRYERSPAGLVTSLVVVILLIGGVLLFRSLFSTSYQDTPENLDYLDTVVSLQESRFPVVYPPSLPEGWIARNVEVTPGERPAFELSLLTGQKKFVGLHQEDVDVDDLVDTLVDENATEGGVLKVEGSVAPRWQEWSDNGGDHAFTAEVGGQAVIVFGSAPVADLELIVRSLTQAKLPKTNVPVTPSTSVTPVNPNPTG